MTKNLLHLNTLDIAVFISLFVLTLLITLWGVRKQKRLNSDEDSYLEILLMGRRLTLPLFVATLASTWYGGIFAVSQIAFETGVYNFLTQGFFWYLTYLVFAFFLFEKLSHLEAFKNSLSMSDMIGNLIGPRARFISAFFNVTNLLPIAYVISLGHFFRLIFDLTSFEAMSLGIMITLAYSLWGGFKSVVYSDVVQFSLMMVSVLMVAIYSFTQWGVAPLQTLDSHYFPPWASQQSLKRCRGG